MGFALVSDVCVPTGTPVEVIVLSFAARPWRMIQKSA